MQAINLQMSSAFFPGFPKFLTMGTRNPQISAKIDDKTQHTLTRIKTETGISEVEVVRALLHALCRHYEEHKRITLPITLSTDTSVEPVLSKSKK